VTPWDRRQLVQAKGRLERAVTQIEFALEDGHSDNDRCYRAGYASMLVSQARTDLRRATARINRRLGQ
jgi:hypothetical protein